MIRRLAALLLAALPACLPARPPERSVPPTPERPRPTLTFCVAPKNLPMSQEEPAAGFDVEVARALAGRVGAEPRFAWLDPLSYSFDFAVADGRCDAAPGAIVEIDAVGGARPAPGVTLTEPYYSAGYLLIRRAEGAPPVGSLDDLRSTPIAVEAESIASFQLRQLGRPVHIYSNYDAVIAAMARGSELYGYVWGPLASWLLRGRADVVPVRAAPPLHHYNFAIAVREQDQELRRAVNAAIHAMIADGTMARIFEAYGGGWRAPSSPQ